MGSRADRRIDFFLAKEKAMKAEELLREARKILAPIYDERYADDDGAFKSDTLSNLEARIESFVANPPRCKNCRWWEERSVFSYYLRGECSHESNGNEDRLDGMGRTMDGGSYPDSWRAAHSGPEFFCRHHEPQPSSETPEKER
jgi:hypothetical protein